MTENEIPVKKNEEHEGPIPTIWRPVFSDIVDAFVKKDYLITAGLKGVSPVSKDIARHIKDYIEDYGEELTQLPEETWESSVSIWMGNRWRVLVDLWTVGEGRSDLVLRAEVEESGDDYIVSIDFVYVP